MNIRLATLDDIEPVSGLLTEFFEYNAILQPVNYNLVKESGEYPWTVISSKAGDFIVAEMNNQIIGLVHVEEDSTPSYPSVKHHKYACIVDLVVKEEHRGKGIGHLLLEKVKDWAQDRNLEYLELMVLENNHIGQHFYEQEQFTVVSKTMRLPLL